MKNRLMRIMLFLAAVVIGGMAAFWLMPHWNDLRAISCIVADDYTTRDRGWQWLTSARPSDPAPRAARVIGRINDALTAAGDDALLHTADVLRPMDLWRWQMQPIDLILRELALRAESHIGDQQLAAVELLDCPFDAPKDDVLAIVQKLLAAANPDVRTLTMRSVLGWAGIDRAGVLRSLEVPDDDHALERLRRLAMSWARIPSEATRLESALTADVLEAALLQTVRAEPDDAGIVIEVMRNWSGEPQPAFSYILRHSDDPAAERELERMAERGIDAARFALHAREPERDASRAREIARDAREPIWRRRLAAWRLNEVDAALLEELLASPVADGDQSVYAVALLAERHHERKTLVDLAEAWMRDLENDRKRAGTLLAALIGKDAEGLADLLGELVRLPDDAHVRTAARLASAALRDDVSREEMIELGYRTLRKPDGDFDADMLLALLAGGYAELIDLLVDQPRGEWRMAIQQRAMLIERFVPQWHEAAGRPISGDRRTIILHFDWLRARRLLESRRIEFDGADRTYSPDQPD